MTQTHRAMQAPVQTKRSSDQRTSVRQLRRIGSPTAGALSAMGDRLNAGPVGTRLQALQRALSGSSQATPGGAAESQRSEGGLPAQLRSGIEQLSGLPMDGVRVHLNSSRPAQLQAHAFTQGTDIHVAPGQERHLPHEAWHVVQQKQGRVGATRQLAGGTPLNDDVGLEQEADTMGAKAIQLRAAQADGPANGIAAVNGAQGPASGVVQRRTTYQQQDQLRKNIEYILFYTSPDQAADLAGRITFNINPEAYQATMAILPAYRQQAEAIENEFRNIFTANKLIKATNYMGDGLDQPEKDMQPVRNAVQHVVDNNDGTMVDARKRALMNAVAKPGLHDKILSANGRALQKAGNLAAAQKAVSDWEIQYYTIEISQVIKAAKSGAINGGANATVWKNITRSIGTYQTHMTTYNGDIVGKKNTYFLGPGTDRASSDVIANDVLPNGAGQYGVHLTAEVDQPGKSNPRKFGNPPKLRDRAFNLVPGVTDEALTERLSEALHIVRGHVWTGLIEPLRKCRP